MYVVECVPVSIAALSVKWILIGSMSFCVASNGPYDTVFWFFVAFKVGVWE